MINRRLTFLLPVLVVVTILASLVTPVPVAAASTTPPDVIANEPPPPPGEKPPKASPPPVPAGKPAPPSSDATYTADAVAASPAAAPGGSPDGAASAAPLALSVDAIANAGAVLIGPQGIPLPFAARETAVVLGIGDTVYFKGSGDPALCDAVYCYYPDIAAALTNFPLRNGSGMIFARGTLTELGPVNVISTSVLNLSKLTGLAWDGSYNYSPWIFNGLLTIQNMLKGFTVDGFFIREGIYASNNAGTLRLQNLYVTNIFGTGIAVTNHKGNIDLSNVSVYGANGNGATLDNSAGKGNITVSNSSFDSNVVGGLVVATNGSVLLERVEANDNQNAQGAVLEAKTGIKVKDSRFNNNQNANSGLEISGGNVFTLQNVEALGNKDMGIYLDAKTGDVSVNGAYLAANTTNGLLVLSNGNVTLNNILAQANSLDNVTIANSLAAKPKTVTVTNSVFTSSAGGAGLSITSRGSVTLNHLRAEANFGDGVFVDNRAYTAAGYTGSGSISLLSTLGLNVITNNGAQGLEFMSKSAITVKGVFAPHNAIGFVLENCAPGSGGKCLSASTLSVTAVDVSNSTLGVAMNVISGGAINLDYANFIGNQSGVILDNTDASAPKAVTVTRSTFNNTINPASISLDVASKGSITLNNVEAKLNHTTRDVIRLDNCLLDAGVCLGSGSVSILNTLGPVQIVGNSTSAFSLEITSHSAVTLKGVISESNHGGASIDNHYGTSGVTINSSSFSHNTDGWGLYVDTQSSLALTSVNASDNQGTNSYGAYLISGGLSVVKSHFDSNVKSGLVANAHGTVTLNNISGNFNTTQDGASVVSNGAITMLDSLGPNVFIFNGTRGLYVATGVLSPGDTGGNISISGVTARNNLDDFGVGLVNLYAATPKTITAQRVTADGNKGGLVIASKGNVTLNAVTATYNKGPGVTIDNCLLPALPAPQQCTGSGSVTLLATLGANLISYNLVGMEINTSGSVTLNNLTANYNILGYKGASGVYIDNSKTVTAKPVVVNQGVFNYNQDGTGLWVESHGVITLNGIDASYNTSGKGSGVFLRNEYLPAAPAVNVFSTLGYNRFNNNGATGLVIQSKGNITLNKVTANENGYAAAWNGALLGTGGGSWISITCGVFNHNRNYGLQVTMGSGVLKFASVAANLNLTSDLNLGGKTPTMGWTICGH